MRAPATKFSVVAWMGTIFGDSLRMRALKAMSAKDLSKGIGGAAVATGAYPNPK
jgi:hypothetical protein